MTDEHRVFISYYCSVQIVVSYSAVGRARGPRDTYKFCTSTSIKYALSCTDNFSIFIRLVFIYKMCSSVFEKPKIIVCASFPLFTIRRSLELYLSILSIFFLLFFFFSLSTLVDACSIYLLRT